MKITYTIDGVDIVLKKQGAVLTSEEAMNSDNINYFNINDRILRNTISTLNGLPGTERKIEVDDWANSELFVDGVSIGTASLKIL